MRKRTFYLERVKDALFGKFCVVCDRPLNLGTHEMCPDCADALRLSELPRPNVPFEMASLFLYKDHVRDALHRFKYRNRTPFGKYAARELAGMIRACSMHPDLILGVPSYKLPDDRLYNQSEFLAKRVAAALHIPFRAHVLAKRANIPSQVTLSNRAERYRNAERAFYPGKNIQRVVGKNILLIDDIVTSGATSFYCRRLLSEHGAAHVICASVARPPVRHFSKATCSFRLNHRMSYPPVLS